MLAPNLGTVNGVPHLASDLRGKPLEVFERGANPFNRLLGCGQIDRQPKPPIGKLL
jgi:hypothetical protein